MCLALLNFNTDTSYSSCTDNEPCTKLAECPKLADLVLRISTLNYKEQNDLRKKQCGFAFGQVLVCCELNADLRTSAGTVGDPGMVNGTSGHGKDLPSAPDCGPVLGNRVMGGHETSLYEFPWMAMLEYKSDSDIKKFDCSGSLINQRYVLTAAHCVLITNTELIGVRLGEWDVRTDPDCEPNVRGGKDCTTLRHVDVDVAGTVVHDGFERQSRSPRFDIALIRLGREVDFNDLIRPICLPKPELRNQHFVGLKMDVSGWGVNDIRRESDVKMKAELGIWDLNACRRVYPNVSIFESQMCAGGAQGIDACNGDSGGPLMTIIDNSYTLAGIVSYGPSFCGTKDKPGVYTRVGAFLGWIKENLEA